MADRSWAVGQQKEVRAGVPRMLAGVPLTKAMCWDPFPRDSLSSPDLGLLSKGHVEATAALRPCPKPPAPLVTSPSITLEAKRL